VSSFFYGKLLFIKKLKRRVAFSHSSY